MPSRSPYPVDLDDQQRVTLDERARTHTAPYREEVRSKIVLLVAEGYANKDIAARLDSSS